jgi:glycine cleavage system H protein
MVVQEGRHIMVALLVLLTVVAFVVVDLYLLRRQRLAREGALATIGPGGKLNVMLHPGHTWVRVTPGGLVSVGASDFAANFAGRLSAIELPREGARLRQGQAAWSLIDRRGRRLRQAMPLDGKVIAVNERLGRHPTLAQRFPYDEGWFLRVRPRHLARSLSGLMRNGAAEAWLESVRGSVTRRLAPALAQDGGSWSREFGEQLDDELWEELRRALFPEVADGR